MEKSLRHMIIFSIFWRYASYISIRRILNNCRDLMSLQSVSARVGLARAMWFAVEFKIEIGNKICKKITI